MKFENRINEIKNTLQITEASSDSPLAALNLLKKNLLSETDSKLKKLISEIKWDTESKQLPFTFDDKNFLKLIWNIKLEYLANFRDVIQNKIDSNVKLERRENLALNSRLKWINQVINIRSSDNQEIPYTYNMTRYTL